MAVASFRVESMVWVIVRVWVYIFYYFLNSWYRGSIGLINRREILEYKKNMIKVIGNIISKN